MTEIETSELRKELDRANFLIEICQRIGACQDIDESLEYLLEVLVEHTDADRGSIFLNDAQTLSLIHI